MPHEFAIGFRFGHSQLCEDYTLSAGHQFSLFNNFDPGPDFHDLRGDRPLTPDRVIDWPFFFAGGRETKSITRSPMQCSSSPNQPSRITSKRQATFPGAILFEADRSSLRVESASPICSHKAIRYLFSRQRRSSRTRASTGASSSSSRMSSRHTLVLHHQGGGTAVGQQTRPDVRLRMG